MKKGIIAITLLLSGALFISPITTNANSIKNNIDTVTVEEQQNIQKEEVSNEVENEIVEKEEVKVNEENTYKPEVNNNQSSKVETTDKVETTTDKKEEVSNKKEEIKKEEVSKEENKTDEVVQSSGMSKSDAQSVLNQYLNRTEQGDMTYTYQGDENTFEAIKEKGIRGYVFLPNVETDMAYLVDKDNGSIYYFHPSGYFEQI